MNRWQLLTALPVATSDVLAALSIVAGATAWLFPSTWFQLAANYAWVARLDPAWFGAGVAAAGCALAYGLLSAQQALTVWLADRHVTALRELHAEPSEALGTEQAMGWELERLGGAGKSSVDCAKAWLVAIALAAGLTMYAASELKADPPRPEGTVYAYVSALQVGNIPALQALLEPQLYQNTLAQTSGTGIYPIIRDLGPITNIQVSTTQLDQTNQAYSFRADVFHPRGISRWSLFVAAADLRIRWTNLEIVSMTPIAPPVPIPVPIPNNQIQGSVYNDVFGSRRSGGSSLPFNIPNANGQIASTRPNWGGQLTPSPPQQSPPPARPVQYSDPCRTAPGACGSGTPGQLNDRRLVEFLFATDRVPKNGTVAIQFTGDRQPNLTFGAAAIHIPEHHRIGRIELPSVWKFWGIELKREQQDDKKHFALRKLSIMPIENWEQLVTGKNAKSALVFVHGFANTFEDALFRNAQIVYDLDYQGLPVLYSWSSRGAVQDYRYDLDSALEARDGFIFILKKLKDLGIEHVDVLAHSMGNLVVLDALKSNASSTSPVQLDQLIMAAPDVARDTFMRQLPDVQKIIQGATLYASSADKALMASKVLAIYPRAGDVPDEGPVVLPNLDTIDVTAVGDELLGLNHSEFASNRAVMNDLKLLIDKRDKPPRLGEIRGFPEPPQTRTHWRYVP
ncbi:alpha/beta hydrolase [Bradyrhizobium sp. MOS001]|uniref:alpha/beta hydrolase n=1 Tax=Bradyrhizobium sp. MOS001 TaxID=2133948 RepID=UPI0010751EDF|nr:alpha/beta hydrolase [Bradyrhizobium sp. MOS001]TFW55794.1 alpha/beta hydrolase [Bradyrhizobium sp. MOS001]